MANGNGRPPMFSLRTLMAVFSIAGMIVTMAWAAATVTASTKENRGDIDTNTALVLVHDRDLSTVKSDLSWLKGSMQEQRKDIKILLSRSAVPAIME